MEAIRGLWLKWSSLRLPWRKRFLVGQDLKGHTYWEFKDTLSSSRLRRTVKYRRSVHHSEVQVPPQWYQWLRYTRNDPPTLEEQQADVIRQAQMKQLARVADEKWSSKPSYLDQPRQQPEPATQPRDPGGFAPQSNLERREGLPSGPGSVGKQSTRTREQGKPWNEPQRGGPSEGWQPESWTPGVAKRE